MNAGRTLSLLALGFVTGLVASVLVPESYAQESPVGFKVDLRNLDSLSREESRRVRRRLSEIYLTQEAIDKLSLSEETKALFERAPARCQCENPPPCDCAKECPSE